MKAKEFKDNYFEHLYKIFENYKDGKLDNKEALSRANLFTENFINTLFNLRGFKLMTVEEYNEINEYIEREFKAFKYHVTH